MLLKFFKVLLLGLFSLIAGCFQPSTPINFSKSGFNINELPEANFNYPYSQEIEMWGLESIDENSIRWKIYPENSGIEIKKIFIKKTSLFKGLEIYGSPKSHKDINILIYWRGLSPPYPYFDKTFTIKINPTK